MSPGHSQRDLGTGLQAELPIALGREWVESPHADGHVGLPWGRLRKPPVTSSPGEARETLLPVPGRTGGRSQLPTSGGPCQPSAVSARGCLTDGRLPPVRGVSSLGPPTRTLTAPRNSPAPVTRAARGPRRPSARMRALDGPGRVPHRRRLFCAKVTCCPPAPSVQRPLPPPLNCPDAPAGTHWPSIYGFVSGLGLIPSIDTSISAPGTGSRLNKTHGALRSVFATGRSEPPQLSSSFPKLFWLLWAPCISV